MNRLVIIGNGFDLAHGLPTGYCDFLNWYWDGVIKQLKEFEDLQDAICKDNIVSIHLAFKQASIFQATVDFKSINNFDDLREFIGNYSEVYPKNQAEKYNRCRLKFNNDFFGLICKNNSIQKWVDIENEYFNVLKDCLNEEKDRKFKSNVIDLNKQFDEMKTLFQHYLKENVCDRYSFTLDSSLNKFFNIENRRLDNFLKEFHFEDTEEYNGFENYIAKVKKNYKSDKVIKQNELPFTNLFLNFNYTPSVDNYIREFQTDFHEYYGDSQHIQIHGRIDNENNPINFGFGDEMDDEYANIEKKNDNKYLKFIKSFQYFQNDNYKKVLEFINSGNFQVYIMGHSCGLSDRTLLNTVFEHTYCKSIKIFYYKYSNPKDDNNVDNYTEIVQNISRHFNDKQLLRRRVVQKTLCEPLPQTQLPLK